MAERKLPKLETGVRFPSSAPTCIGRTGVSRSPAHRTALATPPGGSRWINPGSRRGRGSIDSHPCRPRPPLGLNALVRRLHLQPREPAGGPPPAFDDIPLPESPRGRGDLVVRRSTSNDDQTRGLGQRVLPVVLRGG